jgi:indole-3-glycerol phosphate synthase
MHLNEIIEHKRREIKTLRPGAVGRLRPVKDPLAVLRERPFIAEIKKASPSRGVIDSAADIVARADEYERGGAGAVSVLTDNRYFMGSFNDLSEISGTCGLPLLCKDFIISEAQVDQAYCHGADFILLIAAALNVREIRILSRRAARYSMKVLYELHDEDEFEKIRHNDLELVGVNSRNLKTFAIDKDRAAATLRAVNGDFTRVAESGIETAEDVRRMRSAGADAFLIGTALMIAESPARTLAEFYDALRPPCS